MKPVTRIFESADEMASALAIDLRDSLETSKMHGQFFNIALSGGATPILFYIKLAQPPFKSNIPWERTHFFWGDERCVPPDHSESNYGMAVKAFLSEISIPSENIHRIKGEADPLAEAVRYSGEIRKFVPAQETSCPRFDWILLGIGTDGHVASLFPESPLLRESKVICAVAEHPRTRQNRISITLPVINNAHKITVLAAGENKASIVAAVLKSSANDRLLPAAKITPKDGILEWCLDRAAAADL